MGKKLAEAQLLQNYSVLFQNIKKDSLLSTELAEYGYDATELAKGEDLYNALIGKYATNKKETNEETSAYAAFSKQYKQVTEAYTKDRKKVKIIYKDQLDVLKNLQVKGIMPVRYATLIESMLHFYKSLADNVALQQPLERLKITADYVSHQLAEVLSTQTAYANYAQEKGESQQATKDKDQAFGAMQKWISEFYAIAKIALEDQPQLLESVAKLVRS